MQETTKNSNKYEKISNEQFIFSMELVQLKIYKLISKKHQKN